MHPARSPSPARSQPTKAPAALVLPRAWLEAQITQAHDAHAASSGGMPLWLAHGHMIVQRGWRQDLVLAGPLRQGSWRAPVAHLASRIKPMDGALLLAVAQADQQAPTTPQAWEQWLHRVAPTFARAHGLPDLPLAVLWLGLSNDPATTPHLALASLRTTPAAASPVAAWPTPTGAGAQPSAHWQAVQQLHLPGARLSRFHLSPAISHVQAPGQEQAPTTTPMPVAFQVPRGLGTAMAEVTDTPDWSDDDFITQDLAPARQDSRLAGALGMDTLLKLQHARVAVVGAGRIGSMVAHGLARMGVRHLLLIDSDVMEPHNQTGDVAPLMEGRSKVEALARFIRPIMRPGAVVDTRQLSIDSPATPALLEGVDWIVSCVDNDRARLQANAWALAGHINYLDMATGLRGHVAEADLRMFPPGTGCLACHGGFAQHSDLLRQLQHHGPEPTPADFRQQRQGSLRSWAGVTANLGLRLMEQLTSGVQQQALFRHIRETPVGGLDVQDWHPRSPVTADHHCPVCANLSGAGFAAVSRERLQHLVGQLDGGARGERG
jgi:molybdopterin/thiamine biosynthesis adenylyltransferase